MKRRSACLLLGLAGLPPARAQQRKPGDTPLRLGLETLLAGCGFADALRRRFATDTGLNLRAEAGASSALLEAVSRGEIDVALTHAPALEAQLAAQGLAHDQHVVARSDFLLVGPPLERGRAAAVSHDAARALALIAGAGLPFLTRNDGSGTHLAEQALWRAAGVAPASPWYRPMDAVQGPLQAQARAAGAYALIDRASWLAPGTRADARDLSVLAQGDRRLVTEFRVQRSFVATHHAGKLFVAWLAGPQGQALAAAVPGLRAAR